MRTRLCKLYGRVRSLLSQSKQIGVSKALLNTREGRLAEVAQFDVRPVTLTSSESHSRQRATDLVGHSYDRPAPRRPSVVTEGLILGVRTARAQGTVYSE